MTTKKATTSRAAKPPRKPREPRADRGNMKPGEIRPLAIAARQAYDYQCSLENVPDSMTFDDWRKAEVLSLTGKAGLSCLDHQDFRPVLAHFNMLAGKDDEALSQLLNSGKAKDSGPAWDTRENRDTYAHLIRQELQAHIALATAPLESITDPKLKAARTAIDEEGSWIGEGYVLSIARHKAGKAFLRSLDELADRLTTKQLVDLLATVRNRISTREGRAIKERRKPQKRKPAPDLTLPGERAPF
jgi:hypothetical protein